MRWSFVSAANSVRIESGYMQIRWYQQSSHGAKCADLGEEEAASRRDRRDDEREPELVTPDAAERRERPAHADERREHADSRTDREHLARTPSTASVTVNACVT